jgi:hypothetical protein
MRDRHAARAGDHDRCAIGGEDPDDHPRLRRGDDVGLSCDDVAVPTNLDQIRTVHLSSETERVATESGGSRHARPVLRYQRTFISHASSQVECVEWRRANASVPVAESHPEPAQVRPGIRQQSHP